MQTLDTRFWLWGYSLDTVPGPIMFVPEESRCSIETAARYLGCGTLVWMNSAHDFDMLKPESFERLKEFPQIICGLTHIESNGPGKGGWKCLYKEAARRISELSLQFPNIKGAIIDDFLHETGPSKNITPEEVKAIRDELKSVNPELKLFVVQYFVTQKPDTLKPFADYFDGFTSWPWHSTDYYWKTLYDDEIRHLREHYPDKIIVQGMFVNAYGDGGTMTPQPMDQMELQCACFSKKLDAGIIDGWCALQNGHFCFESHRKQVQFLKDYWEWYKGTRTILN